MTSTVIAKTPPCNVQLATTTFRDIWDKYEQLKRFGTSDRDEIEEELGNTLHVAVAFGEFDEESVERVLHFAVHLARSLYRDGDIQR
jgi:hypothetical protein